LTNFLLYSCYSQNNVNTKLHAVRDHLHKQLIPLCQLHLDRPSRGHLGQWPGTPIDNLGGLRNLCGAGNEYYGWAASATTILTWVMPVLGMLTKAPFEKKQTIATWWTVCRWLGSPIVSLAYIFWNLKVASKCAKLIDMSTPYEVVPPAKSEFADMRDSL
jgi:hypothetical protein